MANPNCPKCGRATYSKRWNSCTSEGCVLNHSVTRGNVVYSPTPANRPPPPMRATKASRPTEGPRAAVAATLVVDSVPSKAALRQKAYRERKAKVSA